MKPRKPKKQPATSVLTTSEPEDALDELVDQLRVMLATATAAVSATAGSDPALIKQAVALVTELRKVESAKRKRLQALTLASVTAFLRQCDPDDRARVGRELANMDGRGSVLG